MMEGDWIAMPGVPLIAAKNPEAAAEEGGDGTDAPGDGARAAEETTGPKSDDARVEGKQGLQTRSSAPRQPREPSPLRLPRLEPPLSPKSMLHLRPRRSPPPPSTPKRTLEATPRRWRMQRNSRPRC
jgi:hypothetical protein